MLSAEQLSDIAKAYESHDGVDPVHQKRRAARAHHNARTNIFRIGKPAAESALAVQMRDLSARGCSFTAKEKIERDSNFVIQFMRENRKPISLLCTAKYCRANGNQFRIGAEFTCVLSGGFSDETGSYGPGDFAEADPTLTHTPRADPDGECVCLIASEGPMRMRGLIGRLLQPLFGV